MRRDTCTLGQNAEIDHRRWSVRSTCTECLRESLTLQYGLPRCDSEPRKKAKALKGMPRAATPLFLDNPVRSVARWRAKTFGIPLPVESIHFASYDTNSTSKSILTSSLALTPAFPGGLIPKSVCFTVVSPV
jgi:hypothetical protein